MKQLHYLLMLLVFPLLLAACGRDEIAAPQSPQGPALIMFYTDNWLPWQEMTPIVNGLESDFTGQATVLQLDANVAHNAQLQQQYGMHGHPTFVVLDENGRSVQTFIGPQTEEVLYEALTAVAAPAN